MFSGSVLQKVRASCLSFLRQGFYEPCCLCDRSSDSGICPDCWRQVQACRIFQPLPTTAAIPPLLAWGCYEDGLKRTIARMKYCYYPTIAEKLGEELGLRWIQVYPASNDFCVVPIPLHPARLKHRGYNQAEKIARGFSRAVGKACIANGLIRSRQTQAQHNLSPQSRIANVKGAFQVGAGLKNCTKPILLIDDIFTTGSTFLEARQLLLRNNFSVMGIAVAAQARLL